MGMNVDATLAYGYDLGGSDQWFVAETTGEWGSLNLSWYDEESSGGFVEQMFNALWRAMPEPPECQYDFQRQDAAEKHWGVKMEHAGSHDYPGYVLAIPGSGSSVDWAETMALDLDDLRAKPAASGWDEKLAAVLAVLGITPIRQVRQPGKPRSEWTTEPVGPRWLVFPFYG